MEEAIRKLYVEASSRCNLRCKMCFRHSWIGERFGDLDPKVFSRVMEDPAVLDVETVFFGGMGEPLVHPALTGMAALASSRGRWQIRRAQCSCSSARTARIIHSARLCFPRRI